MDTLILMRHAKAVREHEATSDRARGLVERGLADGREAGRQIQRLGLRIDAALVSTAKRALETADAALPLIAPAPARFEFDRLYMASEETLFEIAAASNATTVLVIAHNPGIGALAAELVRQSGDNSRLARQTAEDFPTAAFAAFSIAGDVLEAAAPRLIAAWSPKFA